MAQISLTGIERSVVIELGDFDADGDRDLADVDALAVAIRTDSTNTVFDVTGDGVADAVDLDKWIKQLKQTWFGDANLDGEFGTSDLVSVFQKGEYEDGIEGNSGWSEGDWNGDLEFTSGDFITAFQDGGFEQGPRTGVANVPEPTAAVPMLLMILALLPRRAGMGITQ